MASGDRRPINHLKVSGRKPGFQQGLQDQAATHLCEAGWQVDGVLRATASAELT